MDKFKAGDKVRWLTAGHYEDGTIKRGPFRVEGFDNPSYVVAFDNHPPELISWGVLEPIEKWEKVDVPLGEMRFRHSNDCDNDWAWRQHISNLEVKVR